MKKRCFVSLLLCLLVLPITSNAQNYVSISELNVQPMDRWTQTYETQWRTVEIDVQPTIPEVSMTPILQMKIDWMPPDISSLGEGWILSQFENSFSVHLNGGGEEDTVQAQKNLDGITSTTEYYPPFDIDKVYVENNDLSLGDTILHLKNLLIAMSEDPDCWETERPLKILCNITTKKKTGEVLLPGNYYVFLLQKIKGVPLLGHVMAGIESPKTNEISYQGGLLFQMRSSETMNFNWNKLKITNVVSEDIPFCAFSLVQTAIEREIQEGHIRRIFDVDLGYVLYNEPGASSNSVSSETLTYYAIPAWRVNCLYVESAKKELRDYSGLDVSDRNTHEYKTIIVNAQTGEVMDRADNHRGCGDYQGFTSWDDVGGRP